MSEKLLQLSIRVRDDGSVDLLDRVDQKVESIGKSARGLPPAFAAAGGAIAGAFAVHRLVAFGAEAMRLAQVQEQAERRVQSVIRATGQAAGYTLDELKKMAAELQQVTTFGDEAILQAQSLLLTFRNIKGPEFAAATEAMMDMATILGGDLSGAAMQLGKALNDPTEGLSALTRAGVTFTAQQKELIRTLQDTGRTAEAQRVILAELHAQFGDAARAELESYEGRTKALANAWGDFKEVLGDTVTKNQDTLDFLRTLQALVERLGSSVREGNVARLTLELQQLLALQAQLSGPAWTLGIGALWRDRAQELAQVEQRLARVRGELGRLAAADVPRDPWMRSGPAQAAPLPSFTDRSTWGPTFSDFAPVLAAEAQAAEDAIAKARWEVQNRFAQQSLALAEATERRRWEIKARLTAEAERLEAAELAARLPELEDPMGFDLLPERLAQAEAQEEASARRRWEIANRLAQDRMALDEAEAANRQRLLEASLAATADYAGSAADVVRRFIALNAQQYGKYWKYYKALAIAQAIADTAKGIQGTWAGYASMGPWGTAAAIAQTALIAASGAVQIATISQQEPPTAFAKGGIVGLVGEAGPEAIIPLDRLPGLIRETVREKETRGAVNVTVNVPVQGDVSPEAVARIQAGIFEALPLAMDWALREHPTVRGRVRMVARS